MTHIIHYSYISPSKAKMASKKVRKWGLALLLSLIARIHHFDAILLCED